MIFRIKRLYINIICIVFLFSISFNTLGENTDSIVISFPEEFSDDSTYIYFLDSVLIWGKSKNQSKKFSRKRVDKLIRNLKIVLPYAKLAGKKVDEINKVLPTLKTPRARKKYLKKEYKQLMKTYKKPIMKLKFSQGKLLFLLIDRETGHSSYHHIKELRGSVPAILWHTIAKIFGYNLKTKYEPKGKHYRIEKIIQKIEKGKL